MNKDNRKRLIKAGIKTKGKEVKQMSYFSDDFDGKARRYDEDVITVKEFMDMLAIGRNTAYRLIREGKVKSFLLGNSYKILRESVKEYIYSH